MPRSRFGEYTAEGLRVRYERLDDEALGELRSIPALLAYEQGHSLPARVARITKFSQSAGDELRFEYELVEGIPSIDADVVTDLAWELDIGGFEMNRTHWAVKDVDLIDVLREAGVVEAKVSRDRLVFPSGPSASSRHAQLTVTPSVFSLPGKKPDPKLAAVMMPFAREFDDTYRAVRSACTNVGMSCERADDVWDESTLIQDVFNLIYRSAVTIVDLSGRNSNVMYETGIAHTLGRPVVPISREEGGLPFDLAHHRVLLYLANGEGLAKMSAKLERRLRTLIEPKGR
jgi:hypothetical protein